MYHAAEEEGGAAVRSEVEPWCGQHNRVYACYRCVEGRGAGEWCWGMGAGEVQGVCEFTAELRGGVFFFPSCFVVFVFLRRILLTTYYYYQP